MALTTDLEGYWNLDTNVNDSQGTHDGTNTNCTYATGKYNTCLQADATGDEKVEFDDIDFASLLSVSFWFNPNSFNDYQFIVCDDRWSQTLTWSYRIKCMLDGTIQGQVVDGNGNVISAQSILVLIPDRWYHIVLTYDGHTLTLYIDGSSAGTGTAVVDGFTNTNNVLRMMSMLNSSDIIKYVVDGELDEVGLWKRELSSAEVTDLYNGGTGKFFNGTSFVEPTTPSTAINSINSILYSNVNGINGILKTNINKVNGI